MARVKPKNTITSRTLAEAAMGEIDSIDRQFGEWDMNEAKAVAVVRELFMRVRKENNYAGLEAKRALLMKELEAWAEADSANWEKKTLETPFGRLGFRTSTPAVVLVKKVAKSFKAALYWLDLDFPEFVREIKEVNKEAILAEHAAKKLNAEKLRACGLEVKQADEFWIESNAAKDLEEASKKLRAA